MQHIIVFDQLGYEIWETVDVYFCFQKYKIIKHLLNVVGIQMRVGNEFSSLVQPSLLISFERLCSTFLLLLLLSRFSRVWLCATPRWQPTRLLRPWDSPGKNTGVGCHFLLQCMKVKVKSLSPVWLLATPWTAAYQAPPSMGFSGQQYWSGLPLPSPYFPAIWPKSETILIH